MYSNHRKSQKNTITIHISYTSITYRLLLKIMLVINYKRCETIIKEVKVQLVLGIFLLRKSPPKKWSDLQHVQ